MTRRRRDNRGDAAVTREEFQALEQLVRRSIQKGTMGLGIVSTLGGGGGGDDGYDWWFEGKSSSASDADTVGGYTPDEVPYITDGTAPASSPTPSATGGPRYFAVKWTGVTNADLVTYEVHVSASTGFTPDATTLAGETPGSLAYLRKLPDGSDFAYDTDYYFKLVAKDDDGSAAASLEDGPVQLDPNGSDEQAFGSITAEHFQAVISMASAMLAGTWGGTNAQMGYGVKDDGTGEPELDPSFVGIRLFDGSGSTDPVFRVDAGDGTVQVKGRIYFGSEFGSKLTRNDMIQIAEQSSAAFATPVVEQSASLVDTTVSVLNIVWPAAPTPGSLLFAIVTSWDSGGSPTHSAPGFTSYRNTQFDSLKGRQEFFTRVATGDGADDITVTLDKTTDAVLVQYFEFSGVDNDDDAATNTSTGTTSPADTGDSGGVSQRGLVLAAIAIEGNWAAHGDNPRFTSGPGPADFTQIGDDSALANTTGVPIPITGDVLGSRVWMKVADSGVQTVEKAVADVDVWRGSIVSFKAKANAVETADAATARLYTRDIGGVSCFCIVDEVGEQRSVVMGKAGERWDMEVMSGTGNIASMATHTATTLDIPVSGVNVGDVCVFLNKDSMNRSLIMRCPVLATVADQITLQVFNADSGTVDPASDTFYFLVIHRS